MKPHSTPLLCCAALAILLATGGCTAFREFFSDNRSGGGRSTAEGRGKQEQPEGRKRRDPVDDMFDLKRMRDRTPRHQGLQLTPEEAAIADFAEDSAARDRALIDAEKRRMSSDRKARQDWVFSFKPEK